MVPIICLTCAVAVALCALALVMLTVFFAIIGALQETERPMFSAQEMSDLTELRSDPSLAVRTAPEMLVNPIPFN